MGRALNPHELREWDLQHSWHPFTQMREWMAEGPLVIARGEGCYLFDLEGRKYLDGVSSLWANLHGHNHPVLNRAICEQLQQVAHTTMLGLANPPATHLAKRLIELAPPGLTRVFYSDSGATAVEIAVKMAVQYWQLKGETARTEFASLEGAYHGDTVGAMSVGYSETFHRHHRGLLFPCHRIRPPHVFRYFEGLPQGEALEASLAEAETVLAPHAGRLAALIVEPLMQGAAGMWAQPPGYVRALRELTRRHGILLIVDEVATGFGRTGKLFACQHESVTPDLMCLGKGISAGYLPLAATLATEEIFNAFLGEYTEFKTFFHGHTYTGNPLACAAGLESLGIFQNEKTLEGMQPKIAFLRQRLQRDLASLAHVADVRQWGLMVGIELAEDKVARRPYPVAARLGKRVILEARKRGVILRPLGDVIVLMPPLSISMDELAFLLDVTRDSIRAVTEAS